MLKKQWPTTEEFSEAVDAVDDKALGVVVAGTAELAETLEARVQDEGWEKGTEVHSAMTFAWMLVEYVEAIQTAKRKRLYGQV